MTFSASQLRSMRRRLLAWFDSHRRDLPWRNTTDPYRIWLSEIMLQQTRVQTVVPYYQRFVRRFPTVYALARARNVAKFWAGLGYYRRARNLHQAAKQIVREHGGRFPDRLEDGLRLPGVGPYTARAILSIAYGQKLAVVDGNVARVLIRLLRLSDSDPAARQALQPAADRLLSSTRPGDFNQAMMELGSTLCLPRLPRCQVCPLVTLCGARRAGAERELPRKRPRRIRPRVQLQVYVVEHKNTVLLMREANGYFSGLWHFPYSSESRRLAFTQLGIQVRQGSRRRVATLTHQTTMRDLLLEVLRVPGRPTKPPNGAEKNSSARRWVPVRNAARLGVGAATRKILALLMTRAEQSKGRRAASKTRKR